MAQTSKTELAGAALAAYDRGYTPIRLAPQGKRPGGAGWEKTRYESRADAGEAFHEGDNLGVLLGAPSHGLIDVDLDDSTTLLLADLFLANTTPACSGRASRSRSHLWYHVLEGMPERTQTWKHPDGRMLVEVRSTGGQTVLPPSIHPDGDRYLWHGEPWGGSNGPSVIPGDELLVRVGLLALTSLLTMEWPAEGSRHQAFLALAGALLSEGFGDTRRVSPVWTKYLEAIFRGIEVTTGDRADRYRETAETTIRAIQGGKPVQGWPTLAEYLPPKVVERARDFMFRVEEADGHTRLPAGTGSEFDLSAYQDTPLPEGPSDAPRAQEDAHDPQDDDLRERWDQEVKRRALARLMDMEAAEAAKDQLKRKRAEEHMSENMHLIAPVRTAADVVRDAAPQAPRIRKILPWDSSMLLTAQRKTGKTTMLANLAYALFTGEDFLGNPDFEVRALEPGERVAILNYEVNGRTMAGDLEARGVPMDRVILINLRGMLNPFRYERLKLQLAQQLREQNVAAVFVDTFGQAFVGDDQNSAASVSAWLNELSVWTRGEVGAKDLILTAHAGWTGDRTRGSSALEDWPDSIVHLKRKDADDLNSARMLRANGREDVDVEWGELPYDPDTREVTYVRPESVSPADAAQARLDEMTAHEDAVRAVLTEQPEIRREPLVEAARAHKRGLRKRGIESAVDRMVTCGEVLVQTLAAKGAPKVHSLNPDWSVADDSAD